ncbi:uncharacterized protein MEPE_03303 [Melanopsichium pennsylvanicum]|uniref:Uncharacterized protein n=2 Tax=Melanopsichium pennsylvanicum TaxID=63383 RepID=A0AAJ4XKR9_9BASI|nr:putative protein [Melanopsichium pennsylvanicum 4]SNX84594.1 uncharacterized protein MEPE_03303 [Melanopsichium pennsylvanicum]
MSQTDTHAASHALKPPSLLLVAPTPRRPIALVARRHHHHSRSRSSRTASTSGVAASAQSNDVNKESSAQRAASPASSMAQSQATCNPRLVGHPYSRSKTPSHTAAHFNSNVSPCIAPTLPTATDWPLGLGISPVSPPPRTQAASRDGMPNRPVSRMDSRDSALTCSAMIVAAADASMSEGSTQVADNAVQTDEPMLASPIASPPATSGSCRMDVDRTPTKSKDHAQSVVCRQMQPENESEPRSTPTIGPTSPDAQARDSGLILSPISPSQQRITAAASASAQLPLSFSSPPALPIVASASMAPSPSLSESQSRSPSASPSPCPSPSFSTLLDVEPPNYPDRQPRKMGLPLAPMPTSPIPRKMTRNPFERYLTIHRDGSRAGGCTLHARMTLAMAASDKQRSVVDVLEGSVEQEVDDDHEMGLASPTLLRGPMLVSANSNASVRSSTMDVEEE